MTEPWTRAELIATTATPVFHREVGAGPPILTLHGFPQTGECWSGVAGRLADRFRVLAPDLPGYGGSARPRAFDAATVADTLVAYLAAVGVARAIVVGHDWGGAIAYRIARAHPEATERLVVVNSPYGKVDLKRGWYMLAFNLPILPEVSFTVSRGRFVDLFLRLGATDPGAFDPERVAAYRAAFAPLERKRNALAYYRTITRNALLGRRGKAGSERRITSPTMIVWGAEDPALPVSLVDGIARAIPHARIERLPGIGHFVPEEAPATLASLIADFAGRPRPEAPHRDT